MSDRVVTLEARDPGGAVDVVADGVVLARYVYLTDAPQLESPRPYLHPVRSLAGHVVTAYRPHDHVWHKGIAWSLPGVGPHNFWGGPTFVAGQGYVQLDNDGSMEHLEMLDLSSGGSAAGLAHRLVWRTQDGRAVVSETRRLGFLLTDDPEVWVLTWSSAMTNTSGEPLPLRSPTTNGRPNAGYGGLFWRGPRSFTGGTLLTATASGGDELRGQRAAWMAFTGRHDEVDASSTVVMVDAVGNPGHPVEWFARSENFAALCPAPAFSAEVGFDPGAELRFRYATVVADGASDPRRAGRLAALGESALAAEAVR
ncbi:PmoA family protein [Actinotalea sp. M2MS4P-6]|uniref:DUF6807 domain-containing protein n=1 Tax=Actinotalea sp. M2MS4P-6 TaxID=2983762 RepID=UPI0021E3D9C0|nr:PmoA family protein [Actinotalea sp. M2MS4P-6]MCV2394414.1 PmoA family protein [Actinotalea sp. M2MS4P-6]